MKFICLTSHLPKHDFADYFRKLLFKQADTALTCVAFYYFCQSFCREGYFILSEPIFYSQTRYEMLSRYLYLLLRKIA